MFTKIFNFICIYFLSIINFFVMLMPITFFLVVGYLIGNKDIIKYIHYLTFLCISIISSLMLLSLFFDLLFNRTVNYFIRNCNKVKDDDIFYDIFESVKKKFLIGNVDLVIQNSDEINAYAVGGFRKNVVVLTKGLISSYKEKTSDTQEFLICIEGILAHEVSHIVNKDFLPGLLIMVNEKADKILSKILFLIFNIFTRILSLVPYIGVTLSNWIISFYNFLDSSIMFFYNKIFLNIYYFIKLQISRNIEYRADKQGAQTIGGKNMAFALSLLGKSGFFSLFSTHPRTSSRVKSVRSVKIRNYIRPVAFANLCMYLSLLFLIFISIYSYQKANLPQLIKDYNTFIKFCGNVFLRIKYLIISLKNKIDYLVSFYHI